jgi:hypothetical protein
MYIGEIYDGIKLMTHKCKDVYSNDLKQFAISEYKDPYFKFAKVLVEDNYDNKRCGEMVKEYVLKKTFRLQNARAIVEQYKDK